MEEYINKIIHGDCLKVMPMFPDKSFDMILCDLPYSTTQNHWDSMIPLDRLWKEYKRIIKDNGAIVLTAQTPFDKILGVSNLEMLRYEWIWEKTHSTGFLNANKMPLKAHENILVFYKKLPTYNPQKTQGHTPVHSYTKHTSDGTNYGKTKTGIKGGGSTERFPRDILCFPRDKDRLHPTQKPVALYEYLIRTYTNEGDLILDNAAGLITIGCAAMNTGRRFVAIEKEEKYVILGRERLEKFNRAIL